MERVYTDRQQQVLAWMDRRIQAYDDSDIEFEFEDGLDHDGELELDIRDLSTHKYYPPYTKHQIHINDVRSLAKYIGEDVHRNEEDDSWCLDYKTATFYTYDGGRHGE